MNTVTSSKIVIFEKIKNCRYIINNCTGKINNKCNFYRTN